MVKVFLVSKTQPDLPTFLSFCREALGRRVSNLSDSKPRTNELQRFALMLSEAIDANVDNSILDNLGPVLSLFSFTFATVIHDNDYIDVATIFNCEIIRVPAKINGYSCLFISATLRKWREIIIDSLSSNVVNLRVLQLVASIYDSIKAEGFNKLWSDVDISRNQQGFLEG